MPLPVAPLFVGVTTIDGHIRRAMEFAARTDVWIAMARTVTPWPDDAANRTETDNNFAVPIPDNLVRPFITEIEGYTKAQMDLVVPDAAGPIELYGLNWRIVDPVDAYTENARHVWCRGQFRYNEVATNISYRQIGVVCNLVTQPSVLPGQTILTPADVADPGIVEYFYNHRPKSRDVNQRDVLNTIISF
jgi:hypothetical protein